MIVDKVGPIKNGFYALGHPSVPVYLMDGEFPALFDAGFTGLSDLYVEAIKGVLGGRSPAYLFLTHAHWDHVGSAGIFKEIWPDMKIVASRGTREILSRPAVIERVTVLNRQALEALKQWGVEAFSEVPFIPFRIDEVLVPSRSYALDCEATVAWFPSPGHTRDFAVYWIPEKKILIASEAVGCNDVPEFLVDYDVYLAHIERFMAMAPDVLCTGHMLVLTGPDVQAYLRRAWEIAEDYRRFVESCFGEGLSVEETVQEIKRREWDRRAFPKQPLEAYLINTRQRVEVLKRRREGAGSRTSHVETGKKSPTG